MIRARRRCGIVVSSLWTFFILSLTVPTIWHIENIGLQFFWPNVYFKCAFSKIWDCRRCQMSDVINVNASVMWCVLYSSEIVSSSPSPDDHVTTTPSCCYCSCSYQYAKPPPSYVESQRDHASNYSESSDVTAWRQRLIASSNFEFLLLLSVSMAAVFL